MARVLVTGGAGFIGSHLVEALVGRGDEVIVLDDFSTGDPENLASVRSDVRVVEDTICRESSVRETVRGCRVVFHLAAIVSIQKCLEEPDLAHRVNVDGTASVLEAARREGARFVFASSSAVYGEQDEKPRHEEEPCRPASPYGEHKLAGEGIAGSGISLRFFNVYGPRQDPTSAYAAVIPRFVDLALAGRPLTIYGDGLQSRDFVHVRDAVQALLRASEFPQPGSFNVGTGVSTTILDLAAKVQDILGVPVGIEHRAAREGEIRHSTADPTRAANVLGFRPEVGLEEGLETLLAQRVER